MSTLVPVARSKELIVQEADNECLVYDLTSNKALCLNEVSAEIWRQCDGIGTVKELSEKIGKRMNVKLGEDFIWLALADLEKNNLLTDHVEKPSGFENLSRRKVLFKYALPGVMLPVIAAVVAPTATNALSASPPSSVCPGCTPFAVLPVGCPCSVTACAGCVGGMFQCDGSVGVCI